MFKLLCAAAVAGSLAFPMAAMAADTGTYGDVQVVNSGPPSDPTVFQLTSNTSNVGYAGIYFDFTASPITLNDITTLSTDYQMTVGPFAGGAPRFTIFDTTSNPYNAAYVYFGTPDGSGNFNDPNSGWANTGNYAASSDLRVISNGFGGYSSNNAYITWSDLLSHVGGTDVGYVTIDLDGGGFGLGAVTGQQMLTDNFTVNGNVMTAGGVPEPASWALMMLGFGGVGAILRRRARTAAIAA
jgi:hypothetical protein